MLKPCMFGLESRRGQGLGLRRRAGGRVYVLYVYDWVLGSWVKGRWDKGVNMAVWRVKRVGCGARRWAAVAVGPCSFARAEW